MAILIGAIRGSGEFRRLSQHVQGTQSKESNVYGQGLWVEVLHSTPILSGDTREFEKIHDPVEDSK